jgi:hypothetical protein
MRLRSRRAYFDVKQRVLRNAMCITRYRVTRVWVAWTHYCGPSIISQELNCLSVTELRSDAGGNVAVPAS